jgi:hypothetical protein
MSNLEAGSETESNDLWHVQLPTGEVRMWSLDQLDAAFQADLIDERTHVLQDGSTEWVKLGELLGLDSEPPPSSQAPASHAPASYAPSYAGGVQAVSVTPGPVSVAPNSAALYSVRPVVADIGGDDLDLDALAIRPRKKGLVLGVVGTAVAIGLIAIAVTRLGGTAASAPPVSAVSSVLPVPVPEVAKASPPPAPVTVAPAPVEAAPAPATSTADSRLTPSQRKALANADKTADSRRKARAAAAPARAPRTSSKPVFHKGGNKYDPLNSSL